MSNPADPHIERLLAAATAALGLDPDRSAAVGAVNGALAEPDAVPRRYYGGAGRSILVQSLDGLLTRQGFRSLLSWELRSAPQGGFVAVERCDLLDPLSWLPREVRVQVKCGTATHRLLWEKADLTLRALDHPTPAADTRCSAVLARFDGGWTADAARLPLSLARVRWHLDLAARGPDWFAARGDDLVDVEGLGANVPELDADLGFRLGARWHLPRWFYDLELPPVRAERLVNPARPDLIGVEVASAGERPVMDIALSAWWGFEVRGRPWEVLGGWPVLGVSEWDQARRVPTRAVVLGDALMPQGGLARSRSRCVPITGTIEVTHRRGYVEILDWEWRNLPEGSHPPEPSERG